MTYLTGSEWFNVGFALLMAFIFLSSCTDFLRFLEQTGVIAFPQKEAEVLAPESDFITFPILCTIQDPNGDLLASLNLPTQSDDEYRVGFYRKSEVAGFYPHGKKGQLWVEMKNGTLCVTNVRMKDFKQMVES